jgi:hypothetical protein
MTRVRLVARAETRTSAVALSDDVAYVTGFSGRDFAYTEFLVRAYDLSKGRILFEDPSHRNPGSGAAGLDIAVSATKVYAVGLASDSGSADFLIRAYDRDATPPKRKLLTSTPKPHDEGVDPSRSPRTLASADPGR